MKTETLQKQLVKARATVRALQDELAEMNRGQMELPMELEQRADERTAQLRAARSSALEVAANAIVITDRAGLIQWANPAFTSLTGYTPEEANARPGLFDSGPQETGFYPDLWKTIRSGQVWRGEVLNRRKDGSVFYSEHTITPVRTTGGELTHFVAIMQEITDRKRLEQSLKDADRMKSEFVAEMARELAEKEILLQEVHHRVKNNLQVIVSMLNLQADSLEDARGRELFEECLARVRSIALIHERLHFSGNLGTVDFGEYIRELAATLAPAHGARPGAVQVQIVAESVALDLDAAIPAGLILNELVTNALKHAFPAGRCGTLRVDFRPQGPDDFLLSVHDDGVGMPEAFELAESRSLGLKIVRSLTRQLGGILEVNLKGGTTFTLRFPRPHRRPGIPELTSKQVREDGLAPPAHLGPPPIGLVAKSP